ncbi:MAG: hypothetical protein AB7I08_08570 [Thermoleophilia bacterium]
MTAGRSRHRAVAALAVAGVLVPTPTPASAAPLVCDVPVIDQGCDAVGDVVGAVAGAGANAAGDAILGTLTGWVGDGAAWLLEQVATAIDDTTRVNLGASWFAAHYEFMFGVGALLLLPLLLLTVLHALVRQDPGLLARAIFLHLPAAMLLTGLAVAVTQSALAVTDALTSELTAGIARDTGSLAEGLARVHIPGSGIPPFAAFLLALFMAMAAVFVWIELVLRAAAVYVAVMFLPLFLAAMIWPAASGWIRRLVQLLIATVLSKLVIVATLSLGLSAFSSGDDPSAVLAGAGMFLLAAFAPFALYSLLPLVADVGPAQRESRRGLGAATGITLAWGAARARMAGGAAGLGHTRRLHGGRIGASAAAAPTPFAFGPRPGASAPESTSAAAPNAGTTAPTPRAAPAQSVTRPPQAARHLPGPARAPHVPRPPQLPNPRRDEGV